MHDSFASIKISLVEIKTKIFARTKIYFISSVFSNVWNGALIISRDELLELRDMRSIEETKSSEITGRFLYHGIHMDIYYFLFIIFYFLIYVWFVKQEKTSENIRNINKIQISP